MPSPSSSTMMRAAPPSAIVTAMRRAPASSAFSTSSFTALAGRSTTSPAAILLIVPSSSLRMREAVTSTILGHPALKIFARQHFAFFDRRLIERIDAHQFAHENRLQHEVHKERTQCPLVQGLDREPTDRAAATGETFGGGPGLGCDEIAEPPASEIGEAEPVRVLC